MSKRSEAVKRWRENCKQRMLQSMGSKCQICEYDKCSSALEFHHLDLKEKDFSFGATRANPKKWEHIIIELRKCILLCVNCHREVHAGITDIPEDFFRFDETYADYRAVIRYDKIKQAKKVQTFCPVCDKPKRKDHVTCSLVCAGVLGGKVNWELYNPLQLKEAGLTNVAIAVMAGCSEAAVRKRITKMTHRID